MPLRPYQVEGIDFLANLDEGLLCDEPGLGKSAQAIVAAERRGFKNILIVCPAIGRVSWPIELKKWDLTERAVYHIGHNTFGVYKGPAVFIVTYDLLSRSGTHAQHVADLAKRGFFDLLILDEGQYLKDTAAKRTRFVYTHLAKHIDTTWLLSGTITPNHNGELYPHLRALFPEILEELFPSLKRPPNRTEFEDHFCKVNVTTFGRQIAGNRNTIQLRDALKPVLLRRKATELAAELPPLTVETLEFDNDAIDQMLSPTQAHAIAAASLAFDQAYDETLSEAQQAVHIATERRALGLAKVPLASAWGIDLLESGQDKLILFAHHQDVCASLAAAFLDYNPLVITGSTSSNDRQSRIKVFQENPGARVFIGNIQAAGTSITLTAANRVGIVEPSWVPGDNTQAIRRSYRLGQKRPVIATYLSVGGSLDARIAATLIRKQDDIAELLEETA